MEALQKHASRYHGLWDRDKDDERERGCERDEAKLEETEHKDNPKEECHREEGGRGRLFTLNSSRSRMSGSAAVGRSLMARQSVGRGRVLEGAGGGIVSRWPSCHELHRQRCLAGVECDLDVT
ncbi:hypothetical protein GUJ93_ZPchr0006g41172 [Zizania palustris]|uniref:Uncharacterized protein n=1 Tax=Zizania palustris TaxID=103762 RepID=A0A8J5VXL7_ZIZPA|nr:hypothetical protein GUJ93_ZPchr0006g41172 [Zizania palustris]